MIVVYAYIIFLFCIAVYALVRRKGQIFLRQLGYHALIALAVVMLLPFYWMVMTSFKDAREAMAYPPTWWPQRFIWQNYPQAWYEPEVSFTRYYFVSTWTTILTTAGTLVTSILAAYPFAKMRFYGSGLFFYLILATMMVPGEVLLIPKYIILNSLGWLDTYEALVVPWLASVFSIFLMRQFFRTIPDDLWDASQIDGAGRWRYLWLVMVPLSKPVLITSGLFSFIGTWNSLLWPLIVTSSPEMRTLMVGLQVFTSTAGSEFQLLMAASTFCILPVVIIFFFLQRFFIEGIARSGLKS
ncbi:MAG: carbohydrate ABC transporter permease [Candidatus Sumerlaeaceae bacterium]|nr:carbohydrate ABC transporter permease [Candidatus Sumerlaeaceae bacterium]